MGLNGLTLAVPRGALFGSTLDLLDRLGVDTAEVRGNDRKLLFDDAGIVTMRPSDVPTYVEAGAADIGITGKDVLAEQGERGVYELLDLGFGPCTMVFATVEGEDAAAEAPLTGMVDGIVDLTATGTTLRENGLVVREEIMGSTARLIANPVSYRLKAAEIDAVLEKLRAS